jgi:hypothetical protein
VAGDQAGDPITPVALAFCAGYVEEHKSAAMNIGKGNCSSGHATSVSGHRSPNAHERQANPEKENNAIRREEYGRSRRLRGRLPRPDGDMFSIESH